MSLVDTTVVGAIWSVASRLGARFIGLIGTLIITRFLAPEVVGEVGVAVVLVMTGQYASDLAYAQYVIIKSGDDHEEVFHAFFYNLLTVLLVAGILLALATPLGNLMGTDNMERYLPVMVLSLVLERLARIPEAIALRDLHFKLFAVATGTSELAYVVCSLTMAAAGFGGDSIVWANVAQYGLRFAWFALAIERKLWFSPVKITWKRSKSLLSFGFPLAIGNISAQAMVQWDRLIVTGLFGAGAHGVYSMSKRLGAVPADNIGDAIADVLMPSFVRMSADESRVAVVNACHLIAIVVFPLAAGLAVVSPTLVHALFSPEWYGIATPLTILAGVSLIDPMGDNVTAYLKARGMAWSVMLVQLSYLVVLLVSVYVLGSLYGLRGACFGVGVGMVHRAMAALWVARRYAGVSMARMMVGLFRCALAALVMVLAVLAIRDLVTGELSNVFLALSIEIVIGAISYVPAALLIAQPIAKEVIAWVRRRKSKDTESTGVI